jgi:hypothetical protein
MADTISAIRTQGGKFTSEDTLRVTLNTDGALDFCVHSLEVASGGEVTHGGGAPSSTTLHYKAIERDADGDGIIDYSTVDMHVVQAEKGTSVVKVCANYITKAEVDSYKTERDNWLASNATVTESTINQDGEELEYPENVTQVDGVLWLANDGVTFDDLPVPPTTTTIKSGDVTLDWGDDRDSREWWPE